MKRRFDIFRAQQDGDASLIAFHGFSLSSEMFNSVIDKFASRLGRMLNVPIIM